MSRELEALAWIERGDLQAAERLLRALLEEDSGRAVTAANLGAVLQMQDRHQESLEWLEQALQADPGFAAAQYNLAAAHQQLGKRLLAITHYRQALRLDPEHQRAHSSLGNLYRETGRLREALLHLRAALRLQPDCAESHNNLGALYQQKNQHHAALISFQKALELKPDFQEARLNLGHSLLENGQPQEAIKTYQRGLDQERDASAALRLNLSTLKLLSGDYIRGWELYESRLSFTGVRRSLHAEPRGERWDGRPLPPGTPLLLVSEGGLGDTLQFMRYALALRSQGFTISLAAPKRLHSLIQASGLDAAPLTPQQADQIHTGFWTPLLSVPCPVSTT